MKITQVNIILLFLLDDSKSGKNHVAIELCKLHGLNEVILSDDMLDANLSTSYLGRGVIHFQMLNEFEVAVLNNLITSIK